MQAASRKKIAPLWSLIVLAVLAFGVAGYAVIFYLTGHPLGSGFVLSKIYFQDFSASSLWTASIVVHAAGGALALAAGAIQWIAVRLKWRTRQPLAFRRLHIVTGITYTGSIAVAAITGFVLAGEAIGGLPSTIGFLALDIFWLISTLAATVLGNRLRRMQNESDPVGLRSRHSSWMFRSYALTAAAITLRIWLGLAAGLFQLDFVASYQVIAWLCWVPNLVVVELMIRKRKSAKA